MKKERYENQKPFQLIADEAFMRLLKSEAAKDGKTMTVFVIEAIKKLIEEKNKTK